MGKAAKGTPKDIANKIKSKGLQKLKWYCGICEKQCRDENGFRNHTQGEAHQRRALKAGESAGQTINKFSIQFQTDFVRQLRMAHNEKAINANRFYNEYIQNKDHVHMNTTKWHTLTEFCKHLGRNGIVRVFEDDKEGLMIQWIDNSSEALQRADAAKKKERQDRGDEERMQRMLEQQIERAKSSTTVNENTEKLNNANTEEPKQKIAIEPVQALEPKKEASKVRKKNVFASMGKKK